MKKRWLVLLGALTFLVTLVLHVPANLLYAWSLAGKSAATTQAQGVYGTLSSGGFSAFSVNNRPVLKDVRWTLHPAWLALLRLTADLEIGGDMELKLTLSRAVFGKLRISKVGGAANLKSLLGAAGTPGLPMEGQIHLTMDSLQMDAGVPVQATGNAQIQGLTWTLSRDPMVLGDFNSDVSTDDKGILAVLSSGPGPLDLSGEARLAPDRSYDLQLKLKPRAEASAQLQTLVRSLGNPDTQGWYHLRRQGTL